MFQANKDTIDLYKKIVKTRKKVEFVKNSTNLKIKIYIDKQFIGEYTEENLKENEIQKT